MYGYSCRSCCISFNSYIKPQLSRTTTDIHQVVYHLIPTSNHNHNRMVTLLRLVVYHLIPTSNHNYADALYAKQPLYII